MTLFTKAVAATAGLALGGLGSLMAINAFQEDKRGVAIFSHHDNSDFYGLDILSAVACAGIGWLMASICERRYSAETDLDQYLVDSSDHALGLGSARSI